MTDPRAPRLAPRPVPAHVQPATMGRREKRRFLDLFRSASLPKPAIVSVQVSDSITLERGPKVYWLRNRDGAVVEVPSKDLAQLLSAVLVMTEEYGDD